MNPASEVWFACSSNLGLAVLYVKVNKLMQAVIL